jgi:hypothetical protein
MKIGSGVSGPFFVDISVAINDSLESVEPLVFGWCDYSKNKPPVWHQSIVSGKLVNVQNKHWSKISDFNLNVGDIKGVWDLSRFDWLLSFCVEYLKTGNNELIDKLNAWLEDWSDANPANTGINWKCGQESSIRVMHLCVATLILKQDKILTTSMVTLLKQHLNRIEPTLLYAMAQDNNHGTSEAVALYIGGLLLESNGGAITGKRFAKIGRKWLENRAKKLIEKDGSFSQYSVNYHRVMLDSYCLAEVFRKRFEQPKFSHSLYVRLKAATHWLYSFVQHGSGDVPNIGANDGAKLIPLTATDYRDFRPSVQLASCLFIGEFKYPLIGSYHQVIELLLGKVQLPVNNLLNSQVFPNGGYVLLKNNKASLYFRCPKFKFRPGQCDVFHIDLWINNENILRDGGSYSYNADAKWLTYFSGVESHNTIQFDDRNQMPKLSRFLYGNWLNSNSNVVSITSASEQKIVADYKDSWQAIHKRNITLNNDELIVEDEVSGFKNKALLRWRLKPDNWSIEGNVISNGKIQITIESDVAIKRFEMLKGWESRYYLDRTELAVIEVEINYPGIITSSIKWND